MAHRQMDIQGQAAGVSLGVTSVQVMFKSIRLDAITRGMALDEKVQGLNFRHTKMVEEKHQPRRLRIGNNCYWVSFKTVSFMVYKLQLNFLNNQQ